jgi:hypothetical protein
MQKAGFAYDALSFRCEPNSPDESVTLGRCTLVRWFLKYPLEGLQVPLRFCFE